MAIGDRTSDMGVKRLAFDQIMMNWPHKKFKIER